MTVTVQFVNVSVQVVTVLCVLPSVHVVTVTVRLWLCCDYYNIGCDSVMTVAVKAMTVL